MVSRGFRTLLSAGAQAVAVQVLGVAFFYLLSVHLDKDSFGIVSWCNAVAFVVTIVLSLGLEQVVLRRVAAGQGASDWTAGAYFLHALGTGLLTALLLFGGSFFFSEASKARLLPLFFVAQGILAAAVPLRVLLNAKERFAPYAIAALVSNGLKIIAALLCVRFGLLSVRNIALVLIATAVVECGVAALFACRGAGLRPRLPWRGYRALLREAAPQYAVVLFDVGLARSDWVLIGLLSTNAATADYSFAYRAYELARIPITVIGSLLMPRAAHALARSSTLEGEQAKGIINLFTVTLAAAIFGAAMLNAVWAPVVDAITGGAYGTPTRKMVLLLSGCIPLSYAVTILWTVCFAARNYKATARITATVAFVNIALNVVLIPRYGGEGAAAAFLATTALQAALYWRLARLTGLRPRILPVLGMLAIAVAILAVCRCMECPWWVELLTVLIVFPLAVFMTGGIRPAQLRSVVASLRR